MPNIPLTKAAVVNPDPDEGMDADVPACVLRVPHDVIDAICGKVEGEEKLQPTARSLVLYDFGTGTRIIAFEETARDVRLILKSHPGASSDWSAELRTPAGEPVFIKRARYVTCECLPPVAGEDGASQPRATVLFRTRAGEIKSFEVANTDEEIETACALEATPKAAPPPRQKPPAAPAVARDRGSRRKTG